MENTDTRDGKGRFVKGHTVNRKHLLNKSKLRKLASDDELDQVVRGIIDDALEGDKQAREWVAGRLIAPLKPQMDSQPWDLDASSLEAACTSALSAGAAGRISPEVLESTMRAIQAAANIGQVSQLSRRLAELEDKVKSGGKPVDVFPTITSEESPDAPCHPEQASWRTHIIEADNG